MIAELSIPQTILDQLLRSFDGVLGIPDESNIHSDVFVKGQGDDLLIYSTLPQSIALAHHLSTDDEISVRTENDGGIGFNVDTLINVVKKSEQGELTLRIDENQYSIQMPEQEDFSAPIRFTLPRFTESDFHEPKRFGEFHKIDTLPRESLYRNLDQMKVLDDFVNIIVENNVVQFRIHNRVNGDADVARRVDDNEVSTMAQYYHIRPMQVFLKSLKYSPYVTLEVNSNGALRMSISKGGITSKMIIGRKADPHLETHLEI